MKCAKCGLELLEGTKQCPKCGCINEFIETSALTPKRRRSPVIYATIAFAVIGILALVFYAVASKGRVTQVSSGDKPIDTNVTAAASGNQNSGGLTNVAPGTPGNGGPSTPGNVKPKPPKEVVDYLEYVKKVEEHRQMLLKDTTTAMGMSAGSAEAQSMMNLIDMAMDPNGEAARDPLADTKKELNRQYSNWFETLKYFDKKPAPSECREFSGAYRNVIYGETRTIGEITDSLNKVNIMDPKDLGNLLGALQKMKGDPSIQQNIDKSADDADAKLNAVVANYDMKKPFDVPREQKTSGSIMNF